LEKYNGSDLPHFDLFHHLKTQLWNKNEENFYFLLYKVSVKKQYYEQKEKDEFLYLGKRVKLTQCA